MKKIKEKAKASMCNRQMREDVILYYTDSVRGIADRYQTENISSDDLFSVGMIALIDTVDNYGYQETHISTLVSVEVRRAIEKYVRKETEGYYGHRTRLHDAIRIEDYEFIDSVEDIFLQMSVNKDNANLLSGKLFDPLTAQEHTVLVLMYGLDGERKSPIEIADMLGMSTTRINRLAEYGIRKIRRLPREVLASYK